MMSKYFGGGDGSSVENAVILKKFKSDSDKITLQRYWISQEYPYFIPIKIHPIKSGGKSFEGFEYFPFDNDDLRKITYFDVTGLY